MGAADLRWRECRNAQDDVGGLELACQLARSDRDSVHAVTVVPQAWPTVVAGDTDREFRSWAAEEGAESMAAARALLAESRPMRPPRGVSGAEQMVLDEWIQQAKVAQAAALEHLRSLGFTADQATAEIAVGPSWGGAIDRVEWSRGDVLVVGSSSSSGVLARVFLGSSASKIVRNSPVPVIVVP